MSHQEAKNANVHSPFRSVGGAPRKALLMGMFLSVGTAFALSPGCKSYSTCEDTKTCPDEDPMGDGDGDGDGLGGMGGTNGTTEEPSCTSSQVECDGECIDPDTDVNFCGATGSCRGDSAGTVCESDEICVDGACQLDCAAGLVLCDDTCIDPLTNNDYCGAGEGCTAAVACGDSLECVGGECFGWSEVDTVTFGEQSVADAHSVIDANGDALAVMVRTSTQRRIDSSHLFAESMQWSTPGQRGMAAHVTSPVLVTNATGSALLAWLQRSETVAPSRLWVAKRNSNGTWGAAQTVTTSPEAEMYEPAVSLDDDGNAYVAWRQSEGESSHIQTMHMLASETTWSTPTPVFVNVTYTFAGRPQLTPMPAGEALLVINLTRDNATPALQVFTSFSTGGTFPEATRLPGDLPTERLRAQDIASDGQGRAVVAGIIHNSPASPQQVWIAALHEGVWSGPFSIIEDELPTWVDSVQVVLDSKGRTAFLWRELRPTTENPSGNHHLKLFGYDIDEATGTEIEDVPTTATWTLTEPRLRTDSLGNVRVAWWEYPIDQPYPRPLKIAGYHQDTKGWSEPITVGELSDDVSFLSFDLNASGRGILTWVQGPADNDTLGFSYFGPQTPEE